MTREEYPTLTLCPEFAAHLKATGGKASLTWLEQHLATCQHCQWVRDVIQATKREAGEDSESSNQERTRQ